MTHSSSRIGSKEFSMMRRWIPVTYRELGDCFVPTINARDLHVYMMVDEVFTSWIEHHICNHVFILNKDFESMPSSFNTVRHMMNYAITLYMARVLAITWQDPKWLTSELRLKFMAYIDECEQKERAEEAIMHRILSNPVQLRSILLAYTKKMSCFQDTYKSQEYSF